MRIFFFLSLLSACNVVAQIIPVGLPASVKSVTLTDRPPFIAIDSLGKLGLITEKGWIVPPIFDHFSQPGRNGGRFAIKRARYQLSYNNTFSQGYICQDMYMPYRLDILFRLAATGAIVDSFSICPDYITESATDYASAFIVNGPGGHTGWFAIPNAGAPMPIAGPVQSYNAGGGYVLLPKLQEGQINNDLRLYAALLPNMLVEGHSLDGNNLVVLTDKTTGKTLIGLTNGTGLFTVEQTHVLPLQTKNGVVILSERGTMGPLRQAWVQPINIRTATPAGVEQATLVCRREGNLWLQDERLSTASGLPLKTSLLFTYDMQGLKLGYADKDTAWQRTMLPLYVKVANRINNPANLEMSRYLLPPNAVRPKLVYERDGQLWALTEGGVQMALPQTMTDTAALLANLYIVPKTVPSKSGSLNTLEQLLQLTEKDFAALKAIKWLSKEDSLNNSGHVPTTLYKVPSAMLPPARRAGKDSTFIWQHKGQLVTEAGILLGKASKLYAIAGTYQGRLIVAERRQTANGNDTLTLVDVSTHILSPPIPIAIRDIAQLPKVYQATEALRYLIPTGQKFSLSPAYKQRFTIDRNYEERDQRAADILYSQGSRCFKEVKPLLVSDELYVFANPLPVAKSATKHTQGKRYAVLLDASHTPIYKGPFTLGKNNGISLAVFAGKQTLQLPLRGPGKRVDSIQNVNGKTWVRIYSNQLTYKGQLGWAQLPIAYSIIVAAPDGSHAVATDAENQELVYLTPNKAPIKLGQRYKLAAGYSNGVSKMIAANVLIDNKGPAMLDVRTGQVSALAKRQPGTYAFSIAPYVGQLPHQWVWYGDVTPLQRAGFACKQQFAYPLLTDSLAGILEAVANKHADAQNRQPLLNNPDRLAKHLRWLTPTGQVLTRDGLPLLTELGSTKPVFVCATPEGYVCLADGSKPSIAFASLTQLRALPDVLTIRRGNTTDLYIGGTSLGTYARMGGPVTHGNKDVLIAKTVDGNTYKFDKEPYRQQPMFERLHAGHLLAHAADSLPDLPTLQAYASNTYLRYRLKNITPVGNSLPAKTIGVWAYEWYGEDTLKHNLPGEAPLGILGKNRIWNPYNLPPELLKTALAGVDGLWPSSVTLCTVDEKGSAITSQLLPPDGFTFTAKKFPTIGANNKPTVFFELNPPKKEFNEKTGKYKKHIWDNKTGKIYTFETPGEIAFAQLNEYRAKPENTLMIVKGEPKLLTTLQPDIDEVIQDKDAEQLRVKLLPWSGFIDREGRQRFSISCDGGACTANEVRFRAGRAAIKKEDRLGHNVYIIDTAGGRPIAADYQCATDFAGNWAVAFKHLEEKNATSIDADTGDIDDGEVEGGKVLDRLVFLRKDGKEVSIRNACQEQGWQTTLELMATDGVLMGIYQKNLMQGGSRTILMDTNGKRVALLPNLRAEQPEDDQLLFANGLMRVLAEEDGIPTGDGLFGYADRTGKLVIPCRYVQANGFSEGIAAVLLDGQQRGWQYIDRTGKVVFAPNGYGNDHPLCQGRFVLKDSAHSYIANAQGKPLNKTKYASINNFADGLAVASPLQKDGYRNYLYGYLNLDGAWALKPQYLEADDFTQGRAFVTDTLKRRYFIDKTGKPVAQNLPIVVANSFADGLCHVKMTSQELVWQPATASFTPVKQDLEPSDEQMRIKLAQMGYDMAIAKGEWVTAVKTNPANGSYRYYLFRLQGASR